MSKIINTALPTFFDNDGSALVGGTAYVGISGSNPELSPKDVYWDAALTAQATQPLSISNGRILRNGVPAEAFVGSGPYSLTIRDQDRRVVNSSLSVGGDDLANLNFDGRDEFVSWRSAGGTASDGTIASDGTVSYVASETAASLPGLSGWLPFGHQYADHYGATRSATDSTDDSAAFTAMAAYAVAAESATFYLGAGEYRVDLTGIDFPMNVRFIGDGKDQTALRCVNRGLHWVSGAQDWNAFPTVKDMSVIPEGAGVIDYLLHVEGDPDQGGTLPAGNTMKPSFILDGVSLRGRFEYMRGHKDSIVSGGGTRDFASDYVSTAAIYFNNMSSAHCSNFEIVGGYRVGDVSQDQTAIAIQLDGSSVECMFESFSILSYETAIDAGGESEGPYVTNGLVIYCRDGFVRDLSAGSSKPGGFIDNMNFSVSRNGVYLNTVKDMSIGSIQTFHSTFYRDETEHNAVKIDNSEKVNITSIHHRPAFDGFTGTSAAIVADTSSDINVGFAFAENCDDVADFTSVTGGGVSKMIGVNTARGLSATTSSAIYIDQIDGVTTAEVVDSSSTVHRGTSIPWGTTNGTEVITATGTDTDGILTDNYKRLRFNGSSYSYTIQPVTTGAKRGDQLCRHLYITDASISVDINSSSGATLATLTGAVQSYLASWIFDGTNWGVMGVSEVVNN